MTTTGRRQCSADSNRTAARISIFYMYRAHCMEQSSTTLKLTEHVQAAAASLSLMNTTFLRFSRPLQMFVLTYLFPTRCRSRNRSVFSLNTHLDFLTLTINKESTEEKLSSSINNVLQCAKTDPVFLVFQSRISRSDFRHHVLKESSRSRQGLCRSRQSLVVLVYLVDLLPAQDHVAPLRICY